MKLFFLIIFYSTSLYANECHKLYSFSLYMYFHDHYVTHTTNQYEILKEKGEKLSFDDVLTPQFCLTMKETFELDFLHLIKRYDKCHYKELEKALFYDEGHEIEEKVQEYTNFSVNPNYYKKPFSCQGSKVTRVPVKDIIKLHKLLNSGKNKNYLEVCNFMLNSIKKVHTKAKKCDSKWPYFFEFS